MREVSADVAFRLQGVCAGLPPDEFVALVRRIAEVTVKYEALQSGAPRASRRRPSRPTTRRAAN